jgi:hypothetical protein
VPRAVEVHDQEYDRRKAQDERQNHERPAPSGQSGVVADGRRGERGDQVKHNPDDIRNAELQARYHPFCMEGDDFVQRLNELHGESRACGFFF